MPEQDFMHVRGCWVSQRLSNGAQPRLGVVISAVARETVTQLKVSWLIPDRFDGMVAADQVGSGFQNGMDVQDSTPGTGVRSLGIGSIMQQRTLAGSRQVLVDFPESGERHWLPYQHLRQVKGAKHRFITGATGGAVDAERMRLRMLAHAIETWNENTGALSHLDIDPLPHQIHLVHHILASGNFNWLIADDVGLGKTIETGMLLHALTQRGLIQRVLLITPAGLTKQWQEELYHKFKLDEFEIYGEDFLINEPRQWKMHDHVIGSIDRLKQEGHVASLLQAEPWDLVIFDEGHRLSRRQYGQKLDSSERYKLASSLRSKAKHMLLLSATPHQGMQDKFIALLELLRPERREELMLLDLKPEILQDMVYRNHKADVTDAQGNFIFQGKLTRAMKVPASEESKAFDKTLQEYLRQGYEAGIAMGRNGNTIGFVMTVYRKLAASSSAAILNALRNRLARLEMKLNGEHGTDEPVDERYFGEWEEQISTDAKEFFAGEIALLNELIEEAERLKRYDCKLQLFIDEVIRKILTANPTEKVLVFTEYRTTQNYLCETLRRDFGVDKVELINGSMGHAERRDAIARFEDQGQFLISTEAGGEGINLQRQCHIMVNYDLPWNPMRLVQRIGRLYRYGQKKKVVVFNIHQPDTMDQQIIDLLYERIDSVVHDMAVVRKEEFNDGLKDEILGELAELIDVEDILQAATLQGIERTLERIDEALQQTQTATAKQRELFEYAASSDAAALRDNLEITQEHLLSFVLGMCDQLGIEVAERTHRSKLLRLRLPELAMRELGMSPNAASRMDATLDREVAAHRPDTHMLDLNSPLMQYLLNKARDYDFGGLAAVVQGNELGEGALFGAMLRWQGLQGMRMRQEFVTLEVNGQRTQLNTPAISQWLLLPAQSAELKPTPEQCKALFACAESAVNQRLASVSNRYLIPENLQWASAGWTI